MFYGKIAARFMAYTLLIIISLSGIKANINRTMPIDNNNINAQSIAMRKEDIKVLAYSAVDYDGDNRSYESAKKYHEHLDAVSTFSYLIDDHGSLIGNAPVDELELHKQKGINSLALIHNFTQGMFDADLASAVLGSPEKRKNLVNNIVNEISRYSYNGVNIDIENIPYDQQDNYSSFLAELKEKLTDQDDDHEYYLVASIPAKTKDKKEHSWSAGFDYRAIGQYADKVQLMTYDEHWFGGEPGPIASIGWTEAVVKYAISTMEPEKILLGIPAYGYKWASDGTCQVVTPKEFYNLVENNKDEVLWDEASKTPYYVFTNARGITFTTWFENAKSTAYKLDLVDKYNLGGIALWRLGFEEPELWQIIHKKLSSPKTIN
ncbi:MAG: glycosyl hydrolase family 18 protein [Caldicoprobacterales bacterium]